MEKFIYDESNGLWYELQGDYYIPCFILPEQETKEIGVWGMRHLEYLKSRRKATYNRLQTEGKLNTYLYEINTQAEEMFDNLIMQYKKAEDITEKLKADSQMEWVQKMNDIRERVTETINYELIYCI
ncbi:MAG: TnpV protein [Acutalibacteraceae bacterium]|nr:TnpV protein [Acutalibacteraceae bacterium]